MLITPDESGRESSDHWNLRALLSLLSAFAITLVTWLVLIEGTWRQSCVSCQARGVFSLCSLSFHGWEVKDCEMGNSKAGKSLHSCASASVNTQKNWLIIHIWAINKSELCEKLPKISEANHVSNAHLYLFVAYLLASTSVLFSVKCHFKSSPCGPTLRAEIKCPSVPDLQKWQIFS